ncbi:LysM peptidoglycan-binding domain-containing protein [Paenibacillus sp. 1011MAR3C5]|uniref:cell division suppressor protein YneA n=1 Tax=Paenibacillus sp. 1011MAR3C5 TaxID=1675787 RepID=UPI0016003B09|nr:LysM peptidoglycan-binding domain-containing protein [Paenibacillus sp. 1011MAR3C5]
MMIMNPSSYRSIHMEPDTSKNTTYISVISGWIKANGMRIVASLLVAVLLFTSFMLMGTKASGTVEPTEQEQVVTVGSGDSLWSIARRYAEKHDDVRYLVYTIKNRNNLTDSLIIPGQQLIIPDL